MSTVWIAALVASIFSVAAAAEVIAREMPPVTVLLNNAGIGAPSSALADRSAWDRILGVNFGGILTVAQAILEATQAKPRELKAMAPDAPKILLHNVYGWFARVERGVYGLTEAGRAAAVCGSCSSQTQKQVARHKAAHPSFEIDVAAVMAAAQRLGVTKIGLVGNEQFMN